MARVIITDLADADTAKILEEISREAGHRVADKYNARLESLYERLADHPEISLTTSAENRSSRR